MELVYLWVEEFRNISKMEIAFSKNFDFKWLGNELIIKKSHVGIPSDFFSPDILNVNVIVGTNGAGKTSALTFIAQFIGTVNPKAVFAVIPPDKKMIVYRHEGLDIQIEPSEFYEVKTYYTDNYEDREGVYQINRAPKIYYSQTFDVLPSWAGFNCINISTSYLLQMHIEGNRSKHVGNLFNSFMLEEVYEQIKLIRERSAYKFDFANKLKSIGFYYDFHRDRMTDILECVSDWSILDTLANKLRTLHSAERIGRINIEDINIGKVVLVLIILNERLRYENALIEINDQTRVSVFFDLEKIKRINSVELFLDAVRESIYKAIDSKENSRFSIFYNNINNFVSYTPDVNLLRFIIEELSSRNFSVTNSSYLNASIEHQLELMQFDLKVSTAEKFLKLTNIFQDYLWNLSISVSETFKTDEIFKFNWYLSTGELAAFSMYSRLIKASRDRKMIDALRYNCEYVWICLDEAETSYNPEWQRKLVKDLIKYLPRIFAGKKIQLFLATHSPIILSDIPRCNIAFLKSADSSRQEQNNIQETFGANIHTLYSKGFFLDSLIGEFAKNKIQYVIDRLNNPEEQDIEDIQKHIDLIGEPILKNQLQKMLNTKRKSEVDVLKDQVKDLQERLKRLEGGAND